MIPYKMSGKAWRGGDSPSYPRGITVADVVRYEQDELGNDIKVDRSLLSELEKVPAKKALWVTKTRKDAERYGTPYDLILPEGTVVIGDDSEGGYLVVVP